MDKESRSSSEAIIVDTDSKLNAFLESYEKHRANKDEESKDVVAFDVEGVDLSRAGSISLIQICMGSTSTCWLFDFFKPSSLSKLTACMKDILEDNSLLKIVHDPGMKIETK
jgi:ribonuclease D